MRAGRCQHAENRRHRRSCWRWRRCRINRHRIHSPVLQAQTGPLCTLSKAGAFLSRSAGSLGYQMLSSNKGHVYDL